MKHIRFITTAALMTFLSSFAIAAQQPSVSIHHDFDCGAMTNEEAQKFEKELSADGLKDLAKTCNEQASTFQKIATEAASALPEKDVTQLYAKAANAHERFASFTNTALSKN